jgi:hypothetical protein
MDRVVRMKGKVKRQRIKVKEAVTVLPVPAFAFSLLPSSYPVHPVKSSG